MAYKQKLILSYRTSYNDNKFIHNNGLFINILHLLDYVGFYAHGGSHFIHVEKTKLTHPPSTYTK